ncbi:MAG: relaxase/mobilization nuclease domain-containing protein, partial [Bacteroidia bacterium]
MISKVIIGKTFYGACRYVCMDEKRAVVLEAEGVRDYDYKLMAKDFEMQQALRPSLTKAVFHGIISFYPGEKIEDKMMAAIAKKYLREMKIINTQFAIVKHVDKNHSHLHIIANLVNNNGETIKDNWIGLRGKKIAQKLTVDYGLKEAISKNVALTNLEALNEREANKYFIYQNILEKIPQCKSIDDLKEELARENIETLYKYKGQTKEVQGISFKIGVYKYKGSEIDRKFSIRNLEKIIQQQRIKNILQPTLAPAKSKQHFQEEHQRIEKYHGHNKNLLDLLMKPEKEHQQMQDPLLIKKHPKK